MRTSVELTEAAGREGVLAVEAAQHALLVPTLLLSRPSAATQLPNYCGQHERSALVGPRRQLANEARYLLKRTQFLDRVDDPGDTAPQLLADLVFVLLHPHRYLKVVSVRGVCGFRVYKLFVCHEALHEVVNPLEFAPNLINRKGWVWHLVRKQPCLWRCSLNGSAIRAD